MPARSTASAACGSGRMCRYCEMPITSAWALRLMLRLLGARGGAAAPCRRRRLAAAHDKFRRRLSPCCVASKLARVRVDVIPEKLSMRVEAHEIPSRHGPMACWSYVSDGLTALGQTEIVFTLRQDPAESSDTAPDDPLQLFATVHRLAESGQLVEAGGVTEFGEQRFFDHHLLYVPAQPLPGVALPAPCLSALLVTDDELRAVRMFGPARVLARMGQATS